MTWILPALAALAAACGDDADGTPRGPSGPPAAAVEAVTVAASTLRDDVELVGQLEADESVVLRPEVDGVVDAIAFVEGQEVAAGELLVRLRDDEQRAAVAEAEAAQTLAEQAYDRARPLVGDGVLSAVELDRVSAERAAARARAEQARVALARMEIRAPFAGVLGARLVSPGDRVTNETSLVQLDAVARLKLVFTVPELMARVVRPEMPLAVRVAVWPEETFPGEIYFVAPTVDAERRQLLVKARVSNEGRRLRPGYFAQIDLEVARREQALTVPDSVLVQDATGSFVWRIADDGTAVRVPVELGLRRAGSVEIVRGLAAGDRVVSAGTHKVFAGAPVRVVEAAGPPTGKGAAP